MKKVFTFLFMLVLSCVVLPQSYTWEWQNPKPTGNTLNRIVSTSPGNLVAFGEAGIVQKSTDGGSTWTLKYPDPQGREISAAEFINANVGYFCGDEGLLMKTTDGGNTFTFLTSSSTAFLYDIDFLDADTGYAVGANGTILKTKNGGSTWTSVTSPMTNTLYSIHAVSAGNIYIGTASSGATQYLSRSTDYGATWTNVSPAGFNKTIWDVFFLDASRGWYASQDGGKVYYTTDGGTTWSSAVTNGLAVPNSVYFIDANTGFSTNNNNGSIFKTTDGGATWNSYDAGTEAMYGVIKSGSDFFACGRYGSLYKSTDNGQTWNPLFTAVTQKPFRMIKFVSSTTGYACGGSSTTSDSLGFIFKTTDGGATWANIGFNFTKQVYSFSLASSTVWYVGTSNNRIYKTTDGGATFTLQSHPITGSTTAIFYDMGFADANTGYACSSTGKIIKTIDGGTTWTLANSPFGTSTVYAMSVFDAQKVIAVGLSAKAYMTTDGGTSWTQLTTNIPGSYFCTKFYNNQLGYIGGFNSPNPTLAKTTDGGLTWNAVTFPAGFDKYISIWGIGIQDENNVWISDGNGYVLNSKDGGAAWTQADKFCNNAIYSISVVGTDLWFAGNGGTLIKGYKTVEIPVELTSFSAAVKNNAVELTWRTATELNNKGFEVQRASSSTLPRKYEWEKIGFVAGHGSTTMANTYSFTDGNIDCGTSIYRLKQIDFDGTYKYSNVVEINFNSPAFFSLEQNFPNPFNPSTLIKYNIPEMSNVELKVFDITGQEVAALVNELQEAGQHTVMFDAASLSSGVYFYKIKAGNYTAQKKMLLIK